MIILLLITITTALNKDQFIPCLGYLKLVFISTRRISGLAMKAEPTMQLYVGRENFSLFIA